MEHEDCLSVNLCLACPPQLTAGPIHTHCALYDIAQDGTILGDLVRLVIAHYLNRGMCLISASLVVGESLALV